MTTRAQFFYKFKELFPNLAEDVAEMKMLTGNKGIMFRSTANKAKWYTFIIFPNGDWELRYGS